MNNNQFLYKQCNPCSKHAECRFLSKRKVSRSAIAAVLSSAKKGPSVFLMLGLENDGIYKDTYNMCAGKGSNEDIDDTGSYCWIRNMLRELKEEFKIKLTYDEYKKYFYVNYKSKIIIINTYLKMY